MMNIIVNAYAVSPCWGSEPGTGWNWVKSLAGYCRVHVITEGEWREEIEKALSSIPHASNLIFHYLPVDPAIRKMCWNQGDWRFYWHYRKWQKRALQKARGIIEEERIDVIHQLNMIGFREPGFLWKIKGVPFVWGPIGGMENIPVSYLRGAGLKISGFVVLKNFLNRMQSRFSPRVRKAVLRADALLAAVRGVERRIEDIYRKKVILINETGCDVVDERPDGGNRFVQDGMLNILWVGRFIFTKQLGLALRTMALLKERRNVRLHVCGGGSSREESFYKALAEKLGISDSVVWHGIVPHDDILLKMKSADLFLMTSIMEGTPHVVLESVQCCLPILCFDVCGMSAIVNESIGDKIACTNPDDSAREFSDKIRYYMNHPEELALKSANCMIRQRELSWENNAKTVVKLYHSLIK